MYAMGWKRYLQQRETDEKRRKRERLNAERKADQLMPSCWPTAASTQSSTTPSLIRVRVGRRHQPVSPSR